MSKVESSCSCDAATPHLDAGYFAQFGPLLHTMISSSPQSRAPFLDESSGAYFRMRPPSLHEGRR
jgi:hypothetical protein